MKPSVPQPEGGEAQSVNNLCPSVAKNNRPRRRRGGRRPGAGAPPGNLNALKHGRRSAQFAQLGALLATIPEAREALLALARRHQLKQRRAEDVAALLLQRLAKGVIADSARESIEREIEAADREIDDLVYDLYGLTKKERALVESEVRR